MFNRDMDPDPFFNEIREQPPLTASEQAGLSPIKDNGHIILKCSNCQKELVDIWLTHSDMDVQTTMIAKCGYCGDKSFETQVKGVFHLGPANNCCIKDIVSDDNKYIILTGE